MTTRLPENYALIRRNPAWYINTPDGFFYPTSETPKEVIKAMEEWNEEQRELLEFKKKYNL